jgi:hypothetical protein
MGMVFMNVLLAETDATMIFVDQRQKLGGVVPFPINGNTDVRPLYALLIFIKH